MDDAALSGLLTEVGLPTVGVRPTVPQARDAMIQFFDRVQAHDAAVPPRLDDQAADRRPEVEQASPREVEEASHPEVDQARQRTEQLRRSAALELLRRAFVGALQAVHGSAPVPPDPRATHREFRPPIFIERILNPGPYRQPAAAPPQPSPGSFVLPEVLLSSVEAAFEIADRLLELTRPPEPVVSYRPWVEDRALLEFFQQLLEAAAADDGEHALRLIHGLRKDLTTLHAVDVVDFDGSDTQYFRLVTDPAPGVTPHTVRPAMVTQGQLIHRGVAVVPATAPDPDPDPDPDQTPHPPAEAVATSDPPAADPRKEPVDGTEG